MEEGELLTEALVREVREETGLEVVDVGQIIYMMQYYREEERQSFKW